MAFERCTKCRIMRYATDRCAGSDPCPLKLKGAMPAVTPAQDRPAQRARGPEESRDTKPAKRQAKPSTGNAAKGGEPKSGREIGSRRSRGRVSPAPIVGPPKDGPATRRGAPQGADIPGIPASLGNVQGRQPGGSGRKAVPVKSTGRRKPPTASRVHSEQSGLGRGIEDRAPVDSKSTAARKVVRQGNAGAERVDTPAPLTQQGFATPDSLGNEAGRPQSATLQSETGARASYSRADTLEPAGTQAPPVDTKPKGGRPLKDGPKSKRADYMREYMRKRKADQK